MKTLLPLLAITLTLLTPLRAASPNPILDAAAQVSEALAGDNLVEAKVNASKLADVATTAHDTDLARNAGKVSAAASLDQARSAYKIVGAQTATLAHGVSGYSVVSCSMAEAKWVQKGTAVRNPYFGKEMLTCGVIE
jgi:hypothetical protein